MIKEAFEAVIPYLSNIEDVRKFVEDNKNLAPEEIIPALQKRIEEEQGTLQTDFKILLNELSKRINMEM